MKFYSDEFYVKIGRRDARAVADVPKPATTRSRSPSASTSGFPRRSSTCPTIRCRRRAPRRDAAPTSICARSAKQGLHRALRRTSAPRTTPALRERLEYELDVIIKMGFASYFLIVWDFIKYARDHDIPVGSGPRFGGRLGRVVLPADHRSRSDQVQSDLRALPQSRSHLDAGYRHRLLRRAARRSHRATSPKSTARTASRRSSRSARWPRARRCATPAARSACRCPTSTGSQS